MNLPTPPTAAAYPTALCPHFIECGGCTRQDLPYPEQLARKEAALRQLLAPWWQGPVPVVASPALWHYRNKAEFKFDRAQYPQQPPADFERPTVLGFKRAGEWYATFDVRECRILSPVVPLLLDAIRQWLRRRDYRFFNTRDGSGLLRHLVLREGQRSGQRLVLLTAGSEDFDRDGLVAAIRQVCAVDSIVLAVSTSRGDAVRAGDVHTLFGSDAIEDTLCVPDGEASRDLRLRIGPFGFIQVNPGATELLYGHIRAWLRERAAPVLYDLYGGSGGIAFSGADLVDRVISVENFAPASEDGRANAALNGIANVEFLTRKVEGWLGDRLRAADWDPAAAVVVDPARGGLQEKAAGRLAELAPEEFLYVSCKQSSLVRELPILAAVYDIVQARAFDLFPHTDHVELVLRCRRR